MTKAVCFKCGDIKFGAFNRRYLESSLAYRIQELVYGGLRPETVKRLEALGEQIDGAATARRAASVLT